MGFIKTLLSLIGAIVVVAGLVGYAKFGGAVSKMDPKAMGLYTKMMKDVMATGNTAKAMVRVVKVGKDVSIDDMPETMKSIAEEHGMMMVGDVTMFDGTPLTAGGPKSHYTRIFSFCSRSIAQTFLNYSKEFGAFMPCRIMLVEDDKGDKYLVTMDLGLMIHGGYPLSPEMLKLATQVEKTMYEIQDKAASGDF